MQRENKPVVIREEAGVKYYCACGRSEKWPRCDGSHAGSGITPFRVEIDKERNVSICGCGKSAGLPFCDGSHKSIG
jgi:CDGSH iron-sulfur domain-containing protein 3